MGIEDFVMNGPPSPLPSSQDFLSLDNIPSADENLQDLDGAIYIDKMQGKLPYKKEIVEKKNTNTVIETDNSLTPVNVLFHEYLDKEDYYEVNICCPGIKKEDIKIYTKNDILKVTIDFSKVFYKNKLTNSFKEYSFDVKYSDKDKTTISYDLGILTILMFKLVSAKDKEFTIE